MNRQARSMRFADYMGKVGSTDRLPESDLRPVLFGLFGEVGSIMAIAKKLRREEDAYTGYRHAVVEEFGDALWYLAALCRRLKISLDDIFSEALSRGDYSSALTATDTPEWPVALTQRVTVPPDLYQALLQLGEATSALLSLTANTPNAKALLCMFAGAYLQALQAAKMTFGHVLEYNVEKTCGRFVEPDPEALPIFDGHFDEEERIPQNFQIFIVQRKSGKTYLQWNGVFLGDPLTDNIRDEDGYRFHDVFHFAHASVLHWSPTFRALIKHKRKSDPKVDEAQDGGRAIVVEEGLTAWIFSRAKQLDYFEDQKKGLSFDMLKTIHEFVSGYEVQDCPLKLWEDAILQGYEVFRKVRANNGGIVIGDRGNRRITYKPLRGHKDEA
nr:nucleoside triphosphate pyrophosphohydrolase family protein [Nitrosomonas nitrosa]